MRPFLIVVHQKCVRMEENRFFGGAQTNRKLFMRFLTLKRGIRISVSTFQRKNESDFLKSVGSIGQRRDSGHNDWCAATLMISSSIMQILLKILYLKRGYFRIPIEYEQFMARSELFLAN